MNALIIFLFACMWVFTPATGKKFDRCSLAKTMFSMGVPKSELPQWTCLAEHESSFNTAVTNPYNKDGSTDYGIFQINSRYWCKPPDSRFSYNGCKINCKAFLSDDIRAAVKCARQVKASNGWTAWAAWKHCNHKLPSIDKCF